MLNINKSSLLILSLAIALLAAGLFAYGAAQATPTAIHCVTAAETIQDTIDAANPGDIIQVVTTTTFVENLVINKSLTIQGGWSENCVYRSDSWHSTVDGNEIGRAMTIDGSSTPNMTVEISQMALVHGNATGKGGGPSIDAPVLPPPSTTWPPQDGTLPPLAPDASTPAADLTADWQERLADLHTAGRLPGGEATYQEMVKRIDGLLNPRETPLAQALDRQPTAITDADGPNQPDISADCGGGIFVDGAVVNLSATLVNQNVASNSNPGYGGGLCAVNLPVDGITIADDTQFNHNTASKSDLGVGGAIFIHGDDQAAVNIDEVTMTANVASTANHGWGGGIAIFNSPAVNISNSLVMWNEGGRLFEYDENNSSIGGGLYLDTCPDATLFKNRVYDNMADAGGAKAIAGGIMLYESPRVSVDENSIGRNTAHAQVGLLGPFGFGGGLAVVKSNDTILTKNTIFFNLASLYAQGFGGGVYVGDSSNLVIHDNKFEDNTAAYFPNGNQYGGGLQVVKSDNIHVYNNSFKRNMAGTWAVGDHLGFAPGGGGLSFDSSANSLIEDNLFEENTAMLAGYGAGGAITIGGKSHDITVLSNTFHKNTGVRQDEVGRSSIGEGAAIVMDIVDHINILRNSFTNNAGSLGDYSGSVIMSTNVEMGTFDYGGEAIFIDGNQILNSGLDLLPEGAIRSIGIRSQFTKSLTIINNVIAQTQGAGVELEFPPTEFPDPSYARVINNTFASNEGDGLALFGDWYQQSGDDTLLTINNIFSGHSTAISSETDNDLTVDHNLFYANVNDLDGNLTDTNSVSGDPKYINVGLNNYQVNWGSPAIDAGLSRPVSAVSDAAMGSSPLPTHDLRNAHRPYGKAWDIGAYELFQLLFPVAYR